MESSDRKRPHPNDGSDGNPAKSKREDNQVTAGDVPSSNVPEQQNENNSSGQPTVEEGQVPTLNPEEKNGKAPGRIAATLLAMAEPSNSTVNVNETQKGRPASSGRRAPRERKGPTDAELEDFVVTRKEGFEKKVDIKSSPPGTLSVKLLSNYFPMDSKSTFNLFMYHVDYEPRDLRTFEKRKLFKEHQEKFGVLTIFDGDALYCNERLPANTPMKFTSTLPGTENQVEISFQFVAEIPPLNPVTIQIYNVIMNKCLRALNLTPMGRHYYDPNAAVHNGQARLEIWPGYKTSIRRHDRSLMLCVEMTNKVLRQDTVLDIIRKHRGDQDKMKKDLLGEIVMTDYNKRTYRIDDIKFEENPQSMTFEHRTKGMKRDEKGQQVSLAEYMHIRYGIEVKDLKQPILYSNAKKSEVRRGLAEKIALIPELCRMTGLTDGQRADFNLMKKLNETLQLSPSDRVKAINKFVKKIEDKNVPQDILQPMGLTLKNKLVDLDGRKFKGEAVSFGQTTWTMGTGPRDRYDWIQSMTSKQGAMKVAMKLERWAVVFVEGKPIETFIKLLIEQAGKLGFHISPSYKREPVRRGNQSQEKLNFMNAVEQVHVKYGSDIQMLVVILPKKEEELYGAVKKRCYLDYGIPSQCVQDKHLVCKQGKESAQRGIALKVGIQMNAKLQGIPWEIKIPAQGMMVIGFNISQAGRALGSEARAPVGALVATTNDSLSQYFSTVVPVGVENLSYYMNAKMSLILEAYKVKNEGRLPSRIIFYRDGVGEGQLQSVVDVEIEQMEEAIKAKYPTDAFPQFTFIVVNKRINTKFFVPNGAQFTNPGPGTCVDDVVTLPERYDFFLVSQTGTGQGTVSPASYNVIYNENGGKNTNTQAFQPKVLQTLTYKLCHLYYNWTSTVAVPAVCQYAHKLAFLQNIIKKQTEHLGLHAEAKAELCHSLYYL